MIQIIFVLIALYFLFISHAVSIAKDREIVLPKTKYFGGLILVLAIAITLTPAPENFTWVGPLVTPIVALIALFIFSSKTQLATPEPAQTMALKIANILTWALLLIITAGLLYLLVVVRVLYK